LSSEKVLRDTFLVVMYWSCDATAGWDFVNNWTLDSNIINNPLPETSEGWLFQL
jgi:hypothetical protein